MASRAFVSRRLHSFLGAVPLGLFLLVHFTVNYFATRGAEAFDKAASFMEHLPFLPLLEIVFIYLPLFFHAVYGIYIAFQAQPNMKRFGYYRNWLFFFQRVTGLFVIIFLSWHLWQIRLAVLLGKPLDFILVAHVLSNPWMVVFYIVGIVCAVFHFSNGIWAFLVHWGIVVTPKAQKYASYATIIIFIFLAFMVIRTVFAFANPDIPIT